jgi:hypothetical protein
MLSNLKLPEIKTLPVNCPLSCPLKVDRLATDEDNDVNELFNVDADVLSISVLVYNVFTELDTFSKIVKLASISAADKGLPFGILFIIAMVLFYLCVITQININKWKK